MRSNPILEEVWRIKDQLAAEAGYDIHRFFENLRKWEAEHPPAGPVVHSAEDLQRLIVAKERQRTEKSVMVLNEQPSSKKS
jgi:hypothetical protein